MQKSIQSPRRPNLIARILILICLEMQILVANLIFSQLSACSHNTFQYESKRQIAREQKNIANKRGIYCAFRDYPLSHWEGGIF